MQRCKTIVLFAPDRAKTSKFIPRLTILASKISTESFIILLEDNHVLIFCLIISFVASKYPFAERDITYILIFLKLESRSCIMVHLSMPPNLGGIE